MALLDAMADGDLLTTQEVAAKLGYTYASFAKGVSEKAHMKHYKVEVRYPRRGCVWGNKKTIRELSTRKEILA